MKLLVVVKMNPSYGFISLPLIWSLWCLLSVARWGHLTECKQKIFMAVTVPTTMCVFVCLPSVSFFPALIMHFAEIYSLTLPYTSYDNRLTLSGSLWACTWHWRQQRLITLKCGIRPYTSCSLNVAFLCRSATNSDKYGRAYINIIEKK